MTPELMQQLEKRVAERVAEHGPRRAPFPLAPYMPFPRGSRLRDAVCAHLGVPRVFDAQRSTGAAFKAHTGSYAHLLVGKTAEVIEAFLFEGVPGIRAALVDLAAFALVLADTFAPAPTSSSTKPPRSTE
ncbi:MAG TPA: hypothetical protein VGE37_12765 [Archangium sp.]